MSAVVLPTSMSSASGCACGHRERRRHPVGGGDVPWPRPRRGDGHELAGRRQHAQRPVAERVLRRVEHERHPLALGPERVGELGGHGDRHGVGRTARPPRPRPRAAPRRAPRGRARPRTGARPCAAPRPSSHAALVFAPPMSTASVAAAVAGMRVVGVIDLKGGTAVHAVRGERERYRPVRSAIGAATTATRWPSRAGSAPSWGSTSCTSPTSTRSSGRARTARRIGALAREAARHGRRRRQRAGAGAGAAGPRRAPRHRRDRDADRSRRARPPARRAARRRPGPQRRPARRARAVARPAARGPAARWTPSRACTAPACARRSCSTWRAWAAARARTSR